MRAAKFLLGVVVLAVAAIAYLGVELAQRDHSEQESRIESRYTLCVAIEDIERALREDYATRIRRDEAILADQESGLSERTKDAIRQGLAGYRRTQKEFQPDDCVAFAHLEERELEPLPERS